MPVAFYGKPAGRLERCYC